MNKNKFKRFMSASLAALLVVNMTPSAAFASEDSYEENSAIEFDADQLAETYEDPADFLPEENFAEETPEEGSAEETPADTWEEADQEQADAEKDVPEQADAEETIPEQADGEETVPEQADAEETVPEQADAEETVPEQADQEEVAPEEKAGEELPETGSDTTYNEEIAPSGEELPAESYEEEQSGDDEIQEEDPEWADEEADEEEEDPEETPDLEKYTLEMEFSETVEIDPNMLPSEEELLQQYIDRLAFGSGQTRNLLRGPRRPILGDAEQKAYDILKDLCANIASGEQTVAKVTIPFGDLYTEGRWYTADEFGLDYIYEDYSAVISVLFEDYKLNTEQVMNALLVDCPYDLYWFDKNYGLGMVTKFPTNMLEDGKSIKADFENCSYTFYFAVSDDYALAGGDTYDFTKGTKTIVTDSTKTSATSNAVAEARRVVTANAGKSDYERLVAYKDYICDAVSYYTAAAQEDISYGNPWQLIWVFDNDTSTNVVCEGYSKAFKFLCDLDGSLDCSLVSGTQSGGTGAGEHMWNIVTLNGKNYLVDVTNCDEGSIGAPDELFLKGNENGTADGYSFIIDGQTITYSYDAETKALFSANERTLANSDFDPNEANAVASITDDGKTTYYGTLQDAIDAAEAGQTVTLLRDVTENVTINKNVTIDLGGKTLTTNEDAGITVNTNGSAAFTNGTIASEKDNVLNADGGAITLGEGLTVGAANVAAIAKNSGTVTVNDGVIKGDIAVEEDSTFNIKGGYFKTDSGNGDAFTRADGKMLVRNVQDPNKDMYRLADALCYIEKDGVKTYYESPGAAHGDAASGDTIILIKDVDYAQIPDGYLWIRKDITLDLNGFTLTGSALDGTVLVGSNATLTVKDTSDTGNGTIQNSGNNRTIWVNKGTLNIESGTITSASGIPIYAEDTVNISGGTISSDSNKNAVEVRGGSLTVIGGTIEGGGKGIYADSGNVTITDGVIKGSEGSVSVGSGYSDTFTINGGYYSDDAGNGDEFTRPEGKVLAKNSDNLYELMTVIAKNVDTGKIYTSLTAAVNDAGNTPSEIQLFADTTEIATIGNNQKITVDLNGKTLTGVAAPGESFAYGIVNNGDLTIEDSSGNNSGKIKADWSAILAYAGTVTVKGGTLESRQEALEAWTYSSGNTSPVNINVTGGVVTGGHNAIKVSGPSAGEDRIVNITITGGELNIPGTDSASQNDGVIGTTSGNTHVVIDGGTLISKNSATPAITVSNGDVMISGGTVKYQEDNIKKAIVAPENGVAISGGWFTTKVAGDYAAEGYNPTDKRDDAPDADAKFTVAKAPAITYQLPDGAANNPENPAYVYAKDLPLTLKAATMKDRDFQGWYTEETFKNAVTVITSVPDNDLELYAKFGPDKSRLKVLVETVPNPEDVYVSPDGTDVPAGDWWAASQADKQEFETALTNAKMVLGNPQADQYAVDGAFSELSTAYQKLKTATLDKTPLEQALDDAPAPEDVNSSQNGKDVPNGEWWATPTDLEQYTTAYEDATDKLENAATQQEINDAATAITQAKARLNKVSVDTSKLETLYNSAPDPDTITAAADAGDLADGTRWMTPEEKTAYTNALQNAVEILDGQKVTQNDVDAAIAALQQAISTIKTASVDKEALNAAISAASQDKAGTPVSADGKDQKPGTEYVTPAAAQTLADAIEAAQAIADKADATQNEVDAAAAAMNTAKEAFDKAKQTAATDKSELEEAIDAATADKNGTPVSEDGAGLEPGTAYVDQDAADALQNAIDDAQAVADKTDATQNEVDAAKTALDAAKKDFDEAKKTVPTDKTALQKAIKDATDDKNNTPVSTDGKDQKPGTEYVDQAAAETLQDAIDAAQKVADKADATQTEVDAATQEMNDAKAAFDAAKKTATVEKTALQTAVDTAIPPANIQESSDGSDVPEDTNWATPEDKAAYKKALQNAQDVLEDPDATQNEVDNALKAFNDAAAKIKTKGKDVNKAALAEAINAAAADKTGTPESKDGKDVPNGSQYVTQETAQALGDAITTAQTVLNNPDATQDQVDAATQAMNAAKQTFDTSKKTASTNKGDLDKAIDAAKKDKADTPVSADGKDQKPGTKYVDQAAADALQKAIDAAQAVADKTNATQNQVDAAKTAIDAAKKAFDDAKKTVPDPTPTPTPDTDPDSKSDTKPDTDPDSKSDTKPDTDPDSKSDTKPDTDPDSKSDTKPDTDPDSKSDTKPDTDSNTKPDAKVYTITFDLNGGTLDGQTGTITAEYEDGTDITLPKPSREGYTFNYWEGSRYEAGDTYTVTGDHKFTAKWKKESASGTKTSSNDSGTSSKGNGTSASGTGASSNSTTGSASGKAGSVTGQGNPGNAQSVKTGDNTPIGLWLALLIAAVCVFAGAAGFRKKYRLGK